MLARTLIVFLLFAFSLKADQNDSCLDHLFNLLLEADSEIAINRITSNIWDIWYETNDPKIEADFFRGMESMNSGDLLMSVAFFTRVIEKKADICRRLEQKSYSILHDGKI